MNDPFEPRIDDLCMVEVFRREPGEVVNRIGPMNYAKAETAQDELKSQSRYAEYDTRTVSP